MREPLGLAQLLTRTPALGRGSEALDEVLAGRQRRAARSQTGEDGAVCGPASGREFEEPISPGAQTGPKPRHNLLYTSGSLSRLDFLGENPLS